MSPATPPRIDAHHHLWNYSAKEYDWIEDNMSMLRRDFQPADLASTIQAAGIDGVVTVQARQTLGETEWLLSLAEQNDFMRAVVGWVPLVDAGVAGILEGLAARPKLKAVRHVLQGEADNYMLRADFDAGISALLPTGLVYDILVFERQLPQSIQLVDRHPDQVFVLDHIAKPLIAKGTISPWKERITELAQRPNVYCKISGLVTEADWENWTEDGLRPYVDTVLEAFGPERLMFGSDWPVCLVACEYGRWADIVRGFIAELSSDEQDRILGITATKAYNLA
jgi:L-fucono-1,5-lactonase